MKKHLYYLYSCTIFTLVTNPLYCFTLSPNDPVDLKTINKIEVKYCSKENFNKILNLDSAQFNTDNDSSVLTRDSLLLSITELDSILFTFDFKEQFPLQKVRKIRWARGWCYSSYYLFITGSNNSGKRTYFIASMSECYRNVVWVISENNRRKWIMRYLIESNLLFDILDKEVRPLVTK